ncbi:MAG: GNAT family N-acetyltransferase [Burkholderiales bacterium]|nr:GNAT family N-acetyltransferase [Anaerolineae bacterium]
MNRFDFSAFPTISTERLLLREIVAADASDVLAFRGDAEVQRYNSEPLTQLHEALDFINTMHDGFAAKQWILWGIVLVSENKVVGSCSVNDWNQSHNRAEIGYDLARAYWGRGIAAEAVRAIIDWTFVNLQVNRIEAQTITDNARSVRMLERLGFYRDGIRREYSLEDDDLYHGSSIYSLLRREFLP